MPDPAPNTGTGEGSRSAAERDSAVIAEFRRELREIDGKINGPNKERDILDRNFKLRRKNAALEDEVAALKKQQPAADGLVLSKDDAVEYQAFKKLNLKAAELATMVTEHGTLKSKVAERDDEELWIEMADALGFENLPLFMRTMVREQLHGEFKDVQQKDEESGKMVTVRVPMVRAKADDKAALVPLADYLGAEIPELIEALESAPAESEDEEGAESVATQVKRFGAGDPVARKAAGLAATQRGVTMPATRNARPSSGTRAVAKQQEERLKEKAQGGAYAAL